MTKTLFPDVIATMKAAEELIRDGFRIMVYTNDDLIVARASWRRWAVSR